MELQKLLKAYEAVDMLQALSLPVSDEQLRAISEIEKEYLKEDIIPTIESEIEPFLGQLRCKHIIHVTYESTKGLHFMLDDKSKDESIHSDRTQSLDLTKYTIDGGAPLKKRRLVLSVIKKYVESHPETTFQDLEKVFPSSLSGSIMYGVVRKYDDIMMRLESRPNLRRRFFLEPNDIITLCDNTKVVVFNQWGDNIQNFLPVARKFHDIKEFE